MERCITRRLCELRSTLTIPTNVAMYCRKLKTRRILTRDFNASNRPDITMTAVFMLASTVKSHVFPHHNARPFPPPRLKLAWNLGGPSQGEHLSACEGRCARVACLSAVPSSGSGSVGCRAFADGVIYHGRDCTWSQCCFTSCRGPRPISPSYPLSTFRASRLLKSVCQ